MNLDNPQLDHACDEISLEAFGRIVALVRAAHPDDTMPLAYRSAEYAFGGLLTAGQLTFPGERDHLVRALAHLVAVILAHQDDLGRALMDFLAMLNGDLPQVLDQLASGQAAGGVMTQ